MKDRWFTIHVPRGNGTDSEIKLSNDEIGWLLAVGCIETNFMIRFLLPEDFPAVQLTRLKKNVGNVLKVDKVQFFIEEEIPTDCQNQLMLSFFVPLKQPESSAD